MRLDGIPHHRDGLRESCTATLDKFKVPARERAEVLAFVDSTKRDIVE